MYQQQTNVLVVIGAPLGWSVATTWQGELANGRRPQLNSTSSFAFLLPAQKQKRLALPWFLLLTNRKEVIHTKILFDDDKMIMCSMMRSIQDQPNTQHLCSPPTLTRSKLLCSPLSWHMKFNENFVLFVLLFGKKSI